MKGIVSTKNTVCVVQIETRFNSTCTTGVCLSLLFTGLLGEILICVMPFGIKRSVVKKTGFACCVYCLLQAFQYAS